MDYRNGLLRREDRPATWMKTIGGIRILKHSVFWRSPLAFTDDDRIGLILYVLKQWSLKGLTASSGDTNVRSRLKGDP
jgi:hypothetical protein